MILNWNPEEINEIETINEKKNENIVQNALTVRPIPPQKVRKGPTEVQ